MPLPPITRFTAVDTKASPTNNNNGLYVPELTQTQINSIPANTKRNGGMWYNTTLSRLETVVSNNVLPIPAGGGGGDVIGPGASVVGNVTTFADTTGTQIADSGIAKNNLLTATGAATAGKLVEFTGVGKAVQESALTTGNLVTNAGSGADGNIAIFDASGGKVIQDSGVNIKQVPAPTPLFRSATFAVDSNVNVNEISNLGHLRFSNDLGIIFVDTLMPVEFITNNTGSEDQVCSLFTGGLPSSSTTPAALVELQSDSGALLLSRLTTSERNALSTPVDAQGMLLFNKTDTTFDGFNGTDWRKFALFNTNLTLNVAEPLASTNATTKNYVDTAISSIPAGTITLTGNVTGSGTTGSPITTTLNMTLDQIKVPVANLDLNSKNIINLLDPATAQQAATKNYVDTRTITLTGAVTGTGVLGSIATTLTNINTSQITNFNSAVTAFRLDQFAAPISSVSLGSQKIINLLDPTLAQDATTKSYVDNSIALPAAAKFIIQTANASVPNAQVLGSLTTGLLKNTTTTGVLTIGVAGTDYYSPGNPTTIIDDSVNFFIGRLAGNLSLSGTQNTGLGIASLTGLTTGSFNTAGGYESSTGALTASRNSSFGYFSLLANLDSNDNCALGYQALSANGGIPGFNGHNNVAVGSSAGSLRSQYNNCVFLGMQADASVNNLTNAISIGYQASVSASNTMVLGGSGANQLSVGIGITPNAQFQLPTIHANRKIVLYETANNDHQVIGFGTAANTLAFQTDSDTLGVYSWNAGISSSSSVELMNLTSLGGLAIGASTLTNRKVVLFGTTISAHQFFGFGANSNALRYQVDSTSSAHIWYAATGVATSNELMRLTGTGFLGINTASPNAPLQFASALASRKIVLYETANNDHQVFGFGVNGLASNGALRYQIDNILSAHIFYAATSSSASNELMRLTGGGNLLIGTTTQAAKINVLGGVLNIAGEETCIRATATGVNTPKIELIGAIAYELRTESGTGVFSIYNRSASQYAFVTGGTTFVQRQSSAIYYGTASTTTAVVTAGVFVKLNWPAAISSTLFSYNYATSRLTYAPLGQITPTVNQRINMTLTAGHNGATVGEITTFALYKNGVLIATVRDTITAFAAITGTIFSVKTISLVTGTTVVSGDFFEIFVTNTVARTITVTDFNISISST